VLVATDVAARGLDIKEVELVVQVRVWWWVGGGWVLLSLFCSRFVRRVRKPLELAPEARVLNPKPSKLARVPNPKTSA
jgi:hypothetical protein